jgi:hypothetical protein
MVVLYNHPEQIKLVDPSVVGTDPKVTRSGLILRINMVHDAAVIVNIGEQGAAHGEIFEDLSKKWGKPSVLPPGYNSELGAGKRATWGNKADIYADFNPTTPKCPHVAVQSSLREEWWPR